ncbi:MAG: hypothetical protein KC503_09795 [Myxococcales bacterium]|nr:hypothetical protein [Myxococcales bacterium]
MPSSSAPSTSTLKRAFVVLFVAALFVIGDVPAAQANVGDGPATPVWSKLDGKATTVARRRRRRRRRRRPRRRRRRRRMKRPPKVKRSIAPARVKTTRADADKPPPTAPGALRRGARVEFDGRLVQGQTAKSGAIYLFARKRSELRSMVKERRSYRREIVRTIYPTAK